MNNYNNTNYGNNNVYRQEENVWAPFCIILTMIGIPALMYWGYKLWKYLRSQYEVGEIIGMSVGIGVLALMASAVVYAVFTSLWDWWDRQWDRWWGPSYTAPTNSYNNGNNTNNTSYIAPKPVKSYFGRFGAKTDGLLDSERRCPPRATFFGRIDGQPVESVGKYVERHLNTYEYGYWLKQKERSDALKAGLVDETLETTRVGVDTVTKIDYT